MLERIGENTYYIPGDTNIGVYKTGPASVCVIDTGSKGYGEKIDEILMDQGWSLDVIVNTHTHIDHIGGNKYLMAKYNVPAYCTDIDKAFAEYPDLESSYMNGGKPASKLRHIFTHPGKLGFRAIEEVSDRICSECGAYGKCKDSEYVKDGLTAEYDNVCGVDGENRLQADLCGLSWCTLPGHTFGMIGVRTPDDVWFLGDAYLSKAYMQKRSFAYLCDAGEYLGTLEALKNFDGKLFVPAHGVAEADITEILELNIANQRMLIEAVKDACIEPAGLDRILQRMYEVTMLRNNEANHALLSATVKSYLTYLQDKGELECGFEDNVMVWKRV